MWNQLTLQIFAKYIRCTEYFLIGHQICVHLSVLEGHARQRQVIRSVMRRCEDAVVLS